MIAPTGHRYFAGAGCRPELPNKRLKLAAPALKGIIAFVITQLARHSLSAIR